MGIFGGRFKMGRPNPNFWVWANRRLGIFGGHPIADDNGMSGIPVKLNIYNIVQDNRFP